MGRRLQVGSLSLPVAAVKLDGVQSGRIEWPIWAIWLLAFKRPDSGLVVPTTDGHPIKRVLFALEVTDDKSDERQGERWAGDA